MSTQKLGDDLMKVLKLDASGSNWVIYKDRFVWAIDARGLLDHVDGSIREPMKPTPTEKRATVGSGSKGPERVDSEGDFEVVEELMADDEKKLDGWKEKYQAWRLGEAIVKQQIAATIPDSLFMKIQDKGTAHQIWLALTKDFQNKSRMVSMDLRRRLQQQRCIEKGDVRAHFATLRTMREDLTSMGHPPAEDDFYAIVIGSLPPSYDPFVSALNATSSILGTFLSPDDLMHTITDEYDHQTLGRTSKREENVTFYSNDDGGKGKKRRPELKCFNCQKKGHKKFDCWAEGGGKAGQGPRGQGKGDGKGKEDKGKAREAAASAKEPEVAWMAMTAPPDNDDDNVSIADSCPDLNQLLSDDEDELDEEGVSEDWGDWGEEETKPTVKVDSGDAAYTTTFDAGMLTRNGLGSDLIDMELFNSGASRHMTGHRNRLINFTDIEAKPITAADKRTFNAIGKGDMYIDVPNGSETSRVLLRDVLHSPNMGVTLVSIGKITDAGCSVVFHGNICRIFDSSRTLLAEIPKQNGLYRTFTPHSETGSLAARIAEVLTIDELHRRLGHVGHEAARILVEKGLVQGVELDPDSKPTVCPSCVWGKGHRKVMQREREDKRAAALGDEIHSDLWGPAPVESINHKEFFVSFTDDCKRYMVVT